ncbi:hypothetical protein BCV70DRAFT_78714 [Testicularia cyperi]|uniref:Uncharacterized protein n=1 Tax=Testicularia cyperi TaxID=1882483 RepID=A0A317XUW9_9BASI|nr:hypothetical protein BCV70DRAFT_78714 [Testicularia cyperi]
MSMNCAFLSQYGAVNAWERTGFDSVARRCADLTGLEDFLDSGTPVWQAVCVASFALIPARQTGKILRDPKISKGTVHTSERRNPRAPAETSPQIMTYQLRIKALIGSDLVRFRPPICAHCQSLALQALAHGSHAECLPFRLLRASRSVPLQSSCSDSGVLTDVSS